MVKTPVATGPIYHVLLNLMRCQTQYFVSVFVTIII